jgi:hypothetical protein
MAPQTNVVWWNVVPISPWPASDAAGDLANFADGGVDLYIFDTKEV